MIKKPKHSWEGRTELEESHSLTSDYTTKLQDGTSTEKETYINGTGHLFLIGWKVSLELWESQSSL